MLLLIRIGGSAWREVQPTPPDKFQQHTWLLYSNEAGGWGLTWGEVTRGVHQSERKKLPFKTLLNVLSVFNVTYIKCIIYVHVSQMFIIIKVLFIIKLLVASVC